MTPSTTRCVVTRKGIIGIIAHCLECDWTEESYTIARQKAKEHCKKTGHEVALEQTTYYTVLKED